MLAIAGLWPSPQSESMLQCHVFLRPELAKLTRFLQVHLDAKCGLVETVGASAAPTQIQTYETPNLLQP